MGFVSDKISTGIKDGMNSTVNDKDFMEKTKQEGLDFVEKSRDKVTEIVDNEELVLKVKTITGDIVKLSTEKASEIVQNQEFVDKVVKMGSEMLGKTAESVTQNEKINEKGKKIFKEVLADEDVQKHVSTMMYNGFGGPLAKSIGYPMWTGVGIYALKFLYEMKKLR